MLPLQTLCLHALGDVPSPPAVGMLATLWAPSCVGRPKPECLGPEPHNWDQPYTPHQKGVLLVLLCAAVYMLTCSVYWSLAYTLVAVAERRERRGRPQSAFEPLPGAARTINGGLAAVE